ncbi:MAG TPA: helix-turn-helix domain-containing protein [Candidatus Fermentibacter daniensis]|nr:helix-turn-helix domain-containing protein [Candidatus Fermentibacter daniensis]HPK51477.1 helix-turn-helix domain-containing protein [Candidatus Fermentibacter daniensis]
MQDVMYLDDLEQVKVLAIPIRLEILRIMDGRPMTTTQIRKAMKQSQGKLYYHITEMERVGLLQVSETRRKGNLFEKYCLPAARHFRINPLLFRSGDAGRQVFVDTVSSHFESKPCSTSEDTWTTGPSMRNSSTSRSPA